MKSLSILLIMISLVTVVQAHRIYGRWNTEAHSESLGTYYTPFNNVDLTVKRDSIIMGSLKFKINYCKKSFLRKKYSFLLSDDTPNYSNPSVTIRKERDNYFIVIMDSESKITHGYYFKED